MGRPCRTPARRQTDASGAYAPDGVTTPLRGLCAPHTGRRDLTRDQFTVLLGQRYQAQKQQGARTDLTSGQSDQKFDTTAKRIGSEHGVSLCLESHFETLDDSTRGMTRSPRSGARAGAGDNAEAAPATPPPLSL